MTTFTAPMVTSGRARWGSAPSDIRPILAVRPGVATVVAAPTQERALRVLVTGHNGYIGSVLVPMLLGAGHDVVGLDSDLFAPCLFGDAPPQVESMHRDVRDVEKDDLVGFDAVLHLAAVCNDPVGDL